MTIILDNLEPELLEKLQNQAKSHGRSLTEEIRMILTEELSPQNEKIFTEDLSRLEWHEFIERTAGSINDDSFFRHPQGDYPVRETLE